MKAIVCSWILDKVLKRKKQSCHWNYRRKTCILFSLICCAWKNYHRGCLFLLKWKISLFKTTSRTMVYFLDDLCQKKTWIQFYIPEFIPRLRYLKKPKAVLLSPRIIINLPNYGFQVFFHQLYSTSLVTPKKLLFWGVSEEEIKVSAKQYLESSKKYKQLRISCTVFHVILN